MEYIPNALGYHTAGVFTPTYIMLVQRNTSFDPGMSREYNWTRCPGEGEGPLEYIPNALGYQTAVVSTLIWIMLVQWNTPFDLGCLGNIIEPGALVRRGH